MIFRQVRWHVTGALLLSGLALALPTAVPALQLPGPDTAAPTGDVGGEVRAILFYSPRCPHCHEVMENDLPPLMRRHGAALHIVAVNVDSSQGQALYQAVVRELRLPPSRTGVPAMLVGETLLVGSVEIPARLPDLVSEGLADGGIDWPPVPEVRSYLTLQGLAQEASVELEPWMLGANRDATGTPGVFVLGGRALGATRETVRSRFMRDPVGNGVAVVVLVGMVVLLGASARLVARPGRRLPSPPPWAIPSLAVLGMGIAAYLAFVEVSGTPAVCGPVGDCNRVQQSPWASVAGVPIGLLGLGGYLMLGALALAPGARPPRSGPLALLLWGAAATGVACSIYLTFLEPFVIGATCLWCIGSALVMTAILVLATPGATEVRTGRSGRGWTHAGAASVGTDAVA